MVPPISLVWSARLLLFVGGTATAFVMVGPFQGLEKAWVPWDKAAHFLAFYGFTLLLCLSCPNRRRLDLAVIAVFAGSLLELLQQFSGRDAGLGDMLANAAGALAVMAPIQAEAIRARARGRPWSERRRGLRLPAHLVTEPEGVTPSSEAIASPPLNR